MEGPAAINEKHLAKISFNPSNSVIFQPTIERQKITVDITNNESMDILVKWKSTRPAVYHMIPTFSIISSGETAQTELICKGITQQLRSGVSRDRFSIVIIPISTTNLSAKTIWSDFESRKKLSMGKFIKKTIFILYAGINDKVDFLKSNYGEPTNVRNDKNDISQKKNGQMDGNKYEISNEDNLDDLKTTRTAGEFTCLIIPSQQATGLQ